MSVSLTTKSTSRLDLVKQVRDAIGGQQVVRDAGVLYLPMTSGMAARFNSKDIKQKNAAKDQYDFYRNNARFPNIVQDTENGIIGVAFETPPESKTRFQRVTKNGGDANVLAVTQVREVLEAGESIMLVDALKGGGTPFIVEYKSEDLEDIAVDEQDGSIITGIKLRENWYEDDDFYKKNPKDCIREYKLINDVVHVTLKEEDGTNIEDPFKLSLKYIPAFFAGSVDNMPSERDPIPLLPVADSAFAIYRTSADYRQYLHHHWQGTPWATGVTTKEADAIFSMGLGVGAFIALGDTDAEVGMLQPDAGSDEGFTRCIENELKTAQQYAITISQDSSGVEAAESIKLRAATKHATVYTILNSVSSAIESALNCMSEWENVPQDNEFSINTDFTSSELTAQLVTALTGAINAEIYDKSILRDAARRSGWTNKTDKQIDAAIMDQT